MEKTKKRCLKLAKIKWKTKSEIEEEKNKPKEPTEMEIQQEIINALGQELTLLKLQIMMGGI